MQTAPELVTAMLALLRNFPSDGKLPPGEIAHACVAFGLVEKREITKPCRTCGTARLDYSYFRISPAGRVMLAVANKETGDA